MRMRPRGKRITDTMSIHIGPTCDGKAYLNIYNRGICDTVVATLDASQLRELATFLCTQAKAMEEV